MPLYHYAAKDVGGKLTTGTISASSRFEALSQLHAQGLTVTEIGDDPAGAKAADSLAAVRRRFFLAPVTLSDKSVFCRQISISVSAGVPLREALETIAMDLDNATFRAILNRVVNRIDNGMTFSQSITGEPKAFDNLFIALVKSAEESGSLTETLEYLAVSLEKADRLARKIKSIVAYPIFVACFFVIVSVIMTVFVLPKFQMIFASTGGNLPTLTRVVFAANRFLIANGVWIGLALVAVAVAALLYARTPGGRIKVDRLLLGIPVLGPIIRRIAVARFCRNLGIMLHGGVPVAAAIEIATEVLGNKAMESTLRATKDRIMAGNDIASSLDRKTFPRLVVRMVGVGESSGRLPEVLGKVADVYEDQAEGAILVATSLFEPVIIIVFGCMILVLVMAIYLPVFGAAGHIR